ncbi:hypothetical protein H6P81_008269 [Aristolochia fimbriata]|uniref:Uncharacterized protein n=1 Tax=Aristolochia fimbriata TaxID=158543 RepID=A0AAV7F4W6_ARIFI|nr:hypothetical protein H6P81_008269 [Aristolochia fimbriata]
MLMGVFGATRILQVVKKHDSGGLVWKRIKLTSTRKANAKKRLLRVWQNEAVLKACSEPPPPNAPKHVQLVGIDFVNELHYSISTQSSFSVIFLSNTARPI